jgi:flavin reductase (DIM6/NTAB) family NADH-FMN oxidoreductase RutF
MNKHNQILQKLTYGYYVVTALKPGEELKTRQKDFIAAGTINWLTQVSFEPAMVAIAVEMQSDLNETIDHSQHFTIHILTSAQEDWIEKFGGDSTIEDGKINGVDYLIKDNELILHGTIGHFTCKIDKNKSVSAGDHTVHIGEVVSVHIENESASPICTKEKKSQYKPSSASA